MTVYIYGASDDLIEIEGDLREEFNPRDDIPYYLGFSDGTLLKVTYDGDWNIKLLEGEADIHVAGTVSQNQHKGEIMRIPTYSDFAVIFNDVTWVVGGTDIVK